MSLLEGLINGLILVFSYIGVIIIVGFLIALMNKIFYGFLGGKANKFCVLTGYIGTPIHEIGHAIFCLIFFHKIVKAQLFPQNVSDGTLGYVEHTYNKKSIYQKIGNFFIGVGPIIFGSLVMLVLLFCLCKDSYLCLTSVMKFFVTDVPVEFADYPKFILGGFNAFVSAFFSMENISNVKWWIYVVLGLLICIHMTLSDADIKGAKLGIGILSVLLILIPVVISIFSIDKMRTVMGYLIGGASYVSCIYLLAICLAFASCVLALIIKFVLRLFKIK